MSAAVLVGTTGTSEPSTDAPLCFELRQRNLAGATSEPTVVCTEEAVQYLTTTTSLGGRRV